MEDLREHVGLHDMSDWRFGGAADLPELVIGFANVTESTIRWGIAAIGGLLRGEL